MSAKELEAVAAFAEIVLRHSNLFEGDVTLYFKPGCTVEIKGIGRDSFLAAMEKARKGFPRLPRKAKNTVV